MVENFAKDLKLQQAAEMSGMSPQTFSRNFQSVTGRTFVEFLTRVRIGEACGMLYQTEEQVIEISQRAGFNNLANFNRHFLKIKGVSPSQYRQTARQNLGPTLEVAS